MAEQLPFPKPEFDVARRYVRFRALAESGYVSFDFAIGDPDLAVELTMLLPDYRAFCRANRVTYLTREQAEAVDHERCKWRFGIPGIQQ